MNSKPRKDTPWGRVSQIGPSGPRQTSQDVLTEILRTGSQRLLAEALEVEIEQFVEYLRRSRSIEELLPWLCLKGISTGDFSDALASLLGPEAPGSVGQGVRVRPGRRRVLPGSAGGAEAVHSGADGLDAIRQKELISAQDGYRESEQSWSELLPDLKQRDLTMPPKAVVSRRVNPSGPAHTQGQLILRSRLASLRQTAARLPGEWNTPGPPTEICLSIGGIVDGDQGAVPHRAHHPLSIPELPAREPGCILGSAVC